MQNSIKGLGASHANEIKRELESSKGLPFSKILSEESIKPFLEPHYLNFRKRIFSPARTLWAFLSQVLDKDKSCQAAVVRTIGFLVQQGEKACSSNTAAYCKARLRIPLELISSLARHVGRELEIQCPKDWLWRGRHIKLIDGTTLSMPDTVENQKKYPQSSCIKAGLGFPICRAVGVISLATGALLDFSFAPCKGKGTGEEALLKMLLKQFNSGDIVLGDGLYGHYYMFATFIAWGVDAIFPPHSARSYFV